MAWQRNDHALRFDSQIACSAPTGVSAPQVPKDPLPILSGSLRSVRFVQALASCRGFPDTAAGQAVITNFALIETVAGLVVGLEATGVLQLTGGVLGTDVVTEDFTTVVRVTSSGPGQCDLVTIDLAPISVDLLVGVASHS